eukprot:scaffold874_cov126-Cylindrotheca_fusiformis.AAC.10
MMTTANIRYIFSCFSLCVTLLSLVLPTCESRRWEKRQNSFAKFQKQRMKDNFQCPRQPSDKSMLMRQIRRVPNMSVEEFRLFSKNEGAIPFIVENPNFDDSTWTTESFLEECADIPLLIPNYVEGCELDDTCHSVKEKLLKASNKWAGLGHADLELHQIETLGDLLRAQQTQEGKSLYLHDAPLSHYCPPKIDSLKIPKYFPRNYDIINWNPDEANSTWVEMEFQWPSIFISQKGTGSGLHCDSRMTRFYTKMLHGRKLWRLIGPSEYWRMAPNYDPTLTETYPHKFHADVIAPDFQQYPDLDGALVYEAVLKPGDILFAPSAWGHQVVNVENAVMTSLNYYDNESMEEAKNYAEEAGDGSVGNDAWEAFFMPLDDPDADYYQEDIPLDEYVRSQHLENISVPKRIQRWIDQSPDLVAGFRDEDGETALHIAVRFDFYQLVEYLVTKCEGLDINQVDDKHGITPLDLARIEGNDRIADLLEQHGGITKQSSDNDDDDDDEDP